MDSVSGLMSVNAIMGEVATIVLCLMQLLAVLMESLSPQTPANATPTILAIDVMSLCVVNAIMDDVCSQEYANATLLITQKT